MQTIQKVINGADIKLKNELQNVFFSVFELGLHLALSHIVKTKSEIFDQFF